MSSTEKAALPGRSLARRMLFDPSHVMRIEFGFEAETVSPPTILYSYTATTEPFQDDSENSIRFIWAQHNVFSSMTIIAGPMSVRTARLHPRNL